MNNNNILRLAIQKGGRLSRSSEELIAACGIQIERQGERLKVECRNFPLEIYFLRDDDIPEYVANSVVDIGIVGENLVFEKNKALTRLEKLGFSKCRLSIAVPYDLNYTDPSSLNGKTIATTYPHSLKTYLDNNNIDANVRSIRGSTEIAPTIGLSDIICDLVSTGSTLLAHGLREVAVVYDSEAVLVQSNTISVKKQEILNELLFRIRAVLRAKDSKYILMNVPNDSIRRVCDLLPGLRSPSIFPLAEDGWSSIHAVISESDFWEKISELRGAGAEGILVSPIEKRID